MRTKNFYFLFGTLFFVIFFTPPVVFSETAVNEKSKEEGHSSIIDPICMIIVSGKSSYCSMEHLAATGTKCICNDTPRTFTGFVVTRQEYQLICESLPYGSCSDLAPAPESSLAPDTPSKPEPSEEPSSSQPEIFEPWEPSKSEGAGPSSMGPSSGSTIKNISESDPAEIDYEDFMRRYPFRKPEKPKWVIDLIGAIGIGFDGQVNTIGRDDPDNLLMRRV